MNYFYKYITLKIIKSNKYIFFFTTSARSCGTPAETAHGWHAGECYTYGCRVLYQCAEGFELVGRNERTCQADGAWAPKELPSCVRKLLT